MDHSPRTGAFRVSQAAFPGDMVVTFDRLQSVIERTLKRLYQALLLDFWQPRDPLGFTPLIPHNVVFGPSKTLHVLTIPQ